MSVYLCRWPNGDVSLVSGKSRLAIEDVLDEVGNPDGSELIPVNHAVAVHFHLKEKMESESYVSDCLELEGFDERLMSEVRAAYPILDQVLTKEDATPAEIAVAVEQEKNRVVVAASDLSDDPNVAMVQLQANMSKRLAEHHNKTAKAIASRKK